MSSEGGPAAFLGTLGLAVLAGALAYGAHMVAPPRSPGPLDSGPSPADLAQDDPICALMDEMVVVQARLGLSLDESGLILEASDSSESERLDALHSIGQAISQSTAEIADYLNRGAALVADPDVGSAFVLLAHATDTLGAVMGQPAIRATSLDGYASAMQVAAMDPDFIATINQGDAADLIVTKYVFDTCGRDILGGPPPSGETAAKSDVSLLGKEFATYYVDWDEGDPMPVVSVFNGAYYLGDVNVGDVSQGITVTDQYARGSTDWCVEVTSADDPERPWTYSAKWGLAQGTCL